MARNLLGRQSCTRFQCGLSRICVFKDGTFVDIDDNVVIDEDEEEEENRNEFRARAYRDVSCSQFSKYLLVLFASSLTSENQMTNEHSLSAHVKFIKHI